MPAHAGRSHSTPAGDAAHHTTLKFTSIETTLRITIAPRLCGFHVIHINHGRRQCAHHFGVLNVCTLGKVT
jgi:hypothetical protein